MAALKAHTYTEPIEVLLVVAAVLPLFYISFIVLHWLCFRCEIGQRCIGRFQVSIFPSMVQSVSVESLPDRLLNTEDEKNEGEDSQSSCEETAY